jgi:hypothetical protein
LVKEFKNGNSVLVFKINHFLCDGIGAVLLAASLQNHGKPSKAQLPFIRQLPTKEQIRNHASFVTSPYHLALDAIDLTTVNNDNIK